jgi:hypothetical protein
MAFQSFLVPAFFLAIIQVGFTQEQFYTFNASFVPDTSDFVRRGWGAGIFAFFVNIFV